LDLIFVIKEHSIAAHSHSVIIFVVFQSFDIKARAIGEICQLINALEDGFLEIFRNLFHLLAGFIVPLNRFYGSYYNIL